VGDGMARYATIVRKESCLRHGGDVVGWRVEPQASPSWLPWAPLCSLQAPSLPAPVLCLLLHHQPDGPLPDLRRVLPVPSNGSILSSIGASGKSGAVHLIARRERTWRPFGRGPPHPAVEVAPPPEGHARDPWPGSSLPRVGAHGSLLLGLDTKGGLHEQGACSPCRSRVWSWMRQRWKLASAGVSGCLEWPDHRFLHHRPVKSEDRMPRRWLRGSPRARLDRCSRLLRMC